MSLYSGYSSVRPRPRRRRLWRTPPPVKLASLLSHPEIRRRCIEKRDAQAFVYGELMGREALLRQHKRGRTLSWLWR